MLSDLGVPRFLKMETEDLKGFLSKAFVSNVTWAYRDCLLFSGGNVDAQHGCGRARVGEESCIHGRQTSQEWLGLPAEIEIQTGQS